MALTYISAKVFHAIKAAVRLSSIMYADILGGGAESHGHVFRL